jgi:hypothetical protein
MFKRGDLIEHRKRTGPVYEVESYNSRIPALIVMVALESYRTKTRQLIVLRRPEEYRIVEADGIE